MAQQPPKPPSRPSEERRHAERERKPPSPHETREGMPGYGQPEEDVRWKQLPEQEWGEER